MAHYDADGKEIEGLMTPEEVKTANEKAVSDFKAQQEADAAAATTKKAEDDAAIEAAKNTPDPVAEVKKTVDALQATFVAERLERTAQRFAGDDAEKQGAYKTAFSRLSGYADTPEGQAEHAAAAARLAFGDDKTVDVGSMSGTGGGRNVDEKPRALTTDADKALQGALGITPEDVEKYGPKVEEIKK